MMTVVIESDYVITCLR